MKNLSKAAKMAGLGFQNGIRLHKDSIYLFKRGSYPTAYQLSILAQEEFGKSALLEEQVFQNVVNDIDDEEYNQIILRAITSHKTKQGWFSRMADDYSKFGRNRLSRFIKEVNEGLLEEKKQNATYVGLTKKNGKLDSKGKIIVPIRRINLKAAEEHITRVNDYLVKLIEGCRRGVYSVDTEDVDSVLTLDLASELENLWTLKEKTTVRELKKIRKFKIELNTTT